MKYVDINKRYTEIIAEYIAKGYTVNTATMSGSQGEIAKIDLTDGKEIIRIRIDTFSDWSKNIEGVEIIVGKATDDDVKPNEKSGWSTIWNNKLEIISTERFCKIGRYDRGYYGTEEDAIRAAAIQYKRYRQREISRNEFEASDKAMEIAKRIVRRKMGYSRINSSNLKLCKGSNGYFVMYNGKTCAIR